jgi:Ca2+-binding RTX toxin-like protein
MLRGAAALTLRAILASAIAILVLAVPLAIAQEQAILTGTDADDTITGTAQGEAIYARAGNDQVNGGEGDDDLDGGPGADALNGGNGVDAVSYSAGVGVIVSFDGQANDGAPGENDNVGADVENIYGGAGPDNLSGSPSGNTIDGGAGDDSLRGGGGDVVFGGDGNDTIAVRNGRVDRVDCGPGDDKVAADPIDKLSGCEHKTTPSIASFDLVTAKLRAGTKRIGSVVFSGLKSGSVITVTCRRGCPPGSRQTHRLLQRRVSGVHGGATRISLPRRPAVGVGSLLEVIVANADRSASRCRRFGFKPHRIVRLKSRC